MDVAPVGKASRWQHGASELVAILGQSKVVAINCICGAKPTAIGVYELVSLNNHAENLGCEGVGKTKFHPA